MRRGGWARCLFALLLLPFLACGAARADTPADVLMNERIVVPADGQTHDFTFSPTANNLYAFRSFGEGTARAQLYAAGEELPVASGEGFSFQARLTADATYTIRVTSQGAPVEVEMMRAALGRSFDQPIQLDDLAGYDKAISRAYDTHWYRFTAPTSGLYVIRTTSQINTVGYLLDEAGRRLAVSDNLYSPYCVDFRLQYILAAGRTYVVRVSGRGSETGRYHLTLTAPEPGQLPPESFRLSQEQLTLREGDRAALTYQTLPEGAISDAVWVTSDAEVASVRQDGTVEAHAAGRAQIILSGVNGVEARCQVTVERIAATGLSVQETRYTLHAGETLEIPYQVTPANASNQSVSLTSSDPSVVAVAAKGLLVAQAPGEAQVTLTTDDGGHSQRVTVLVERARSQYRALVMGLQRYEDGDFRVGAVNTTQGIADLMARQSYDGLAAEVTVKLDVTRAEAVAAIRDAFSEARETDVSILYVNSHGGVDGRTPWLKFSDGKRLTAAQLERALRRVKGVVVLIIDCCQSGAFISADTRNTFNHRLIQSFSSGSAGRMASGKYRILTSTSARQDSYRVSGDNFASENNTATVFARSLTEAGGWDLMGDKGGRLRADLNQDQKITLHEAYLYCKRRVNQYLSAKRSVVQDVQVYPTGSQFVLFARE